MCKSPSRISLRPHGLQPARLLCPWDSPGKNTGVDCHFLLQGIFSTQGLNLGLPHCRQILYQLSCQGSPKEKPILHLSPHQNFLRSFISFFSFILKYMGTSEYGEYATNVKIIFISILVKILPTNIIMLNDLSKLKCSGKYFKIHRYVKKENNLCGLFFFSFLII